MICTFVRVLDGRFFDSSDGVFCAGSNNPDPWTSFAWYMLYHVIRGSDQLGGMVPPTRTRRFPHYSWKRTASSYPTNCQEKVLQRYSTFIIFNSPEPWFSTMESFNFSPAANAPWNEYWCTFILRFHLSLGTTCKRNVTAKLNASKSIFKTRRNTSGFHEIRLRHLMCRLREINENENNLFNF